MEGRDFPLVGSSISLVGTETALELNLQLPRPLNKERKSELERELENVIRRHLPHGHFRVVLTTRTDRLILRVSMPKAK